MMKDDKQEKSKTCDNCKWLEDGIGCEIYPCAWNWLSLREYEFGCNQFKIKDGCDE